MTGVFLWANPGGERRAAKSSWAFVYAGQGLKSATAERWRECRPRTRPWHETCKHERLYGSTERRRRTGFPWPGAKNPSQGGGCGRVRNLLFVGPYLISHPTQNLRRFSSQRRPPNWVAAVFSSHSPNLV